MRVRGYAALFATPDLEGDVIRRGAFRRSIDARASAPMLIKHDTRLLAGVWERLVEDSRGLFAEGRLLETAPAAALARRLLQRGVDGLSIGFVATLARAVPGGRELLAVDLLEISLVPTPMQPRARLIVSSLKESA